MRRLFKNKMPLLVRLGWLGTIANIIGAMLVAFGFMLHGDIIFIIGSSVWGAVAFCNRDYPLLALNMAFLFINFIGLYRAY